MERFTALKRFLNKKTKKKKTKRKVFTIETPPVDSNHNINAALKLIKKK